MPGVSPVPDTPHGKSRPLYRVRVGDRLGPGLALLILLAAPAAPAQTGIDAQENLFGATNINAVTGHGRLTVGVSRDGDVTVLSWPGPSYSDQLAYRSSNDLDARSQPRFGALAGAGVVLGLVLERAGGQREVSWLRDRQRWTIAQDYGPAAGPNPHTRYASAALGLTVEVVDAVAPAADLLLRRVIVERSAGSPVERAWLLTYANLSPVPPDSRLPELPLVDWAKDGANDFAALWDAQQQAVIHFHPAGRRSAADLYDLLLPPAVDWGPLGAQLGQGPPDAAGLAALVEGLDAAYGAGAYLALSSVPPPDQHQIGIDAAPFCEQFDALAANIQALPEVFPGFEPPIDPAVAGALGCADSGADIAAEQGWIHRPQDALADAADGALAGSDLAAGEVSEALRTPLAFSPAGRAEAAMLLAAGADLAAVRVALATGADPAAVVERAERTVADWLDGLTIPGAAGSRVRAVARRSLINLRLGTDAASGAVVASIARQPPYAMDWPRDGAFFNVMLDVSGQSALVDRRIALYADWQRAQPVAPSDIIDPPPPTDPDSGRAETYPADAWEMNYYADGMVGGTFRFEIDTTAFAVWTMVAHAGWVERPGDYLERYWPHIRRGAELLARWRDPVTGLQAPAQEDDQAAHTQTLHGAIAVFGALDIAARAARRLGRDETALGWEQRAVELRDAIRTHFYDADAGVYFMTESGRLPIQASGMVPIGPTAWLVWPFALHPWSDEQIQRQLERDWGIVEPVIGLRTAGGLYFMKTTLSLALAGDARFDELRESLPATLAAQASPGSDHFGEVMVVVERDGETFAEQRVSTPHLWEGALFFLTAAAAEDPQALTRYDAVLPASRVVDWPRRGGGCGCGRGGAGSPGGWLSGLLLLALLARRHFAA